MRRNQRNNLYKRTMEVAELIALKQLFFKSVKLDDDFSNSRPLVYARSVFSAAFRKAGPSKLGRVLGRNHASICHYLRNHDENMKYSDYAQMYEHALNFRKEIYAGTDLPYLTTDDLIALIKELREELRKSEQRVADMYIYKDKLEELKALL